MWFGSSVTVNEKLVLLRVLHASGAGPNSLGGSGATPTPVCITLLSCKQYRTLCLRYGLDRFVAMHWAGQHSSRDQIFVLLGSMF